MNRIHCPDCGEELPAAANYCAFCGNLVALPGHSSTLLANEGNDQQNRIEEHVVEDDEPTALSSFAQKQDAQRHDLTLTASNQRGGVPGTMVSAPALWRRGLITRPLLDDLLDPDILKDDEDLHLATWHKDVQPTPNRLKPIYPPRPTPPRVMVPAPYVGRSRRRLPPGIVVWASLLVMIALVLSGIFGVFVSLGRGLAGTPDSGELALEVTPGSVAIGGLITLRGVNFSPHTHVGLTRDNALPMWDTSDNTIITTDANGNFSDTVQVLQDWGAGPHTLNAEDAVTHKLASFPILVTGQSGPLRPAHLFLSQNTLDLGTGDPSENTVKTVALTNTGGGPISWQAHTAADWLLVSPASGTFLSGQSIQIKVAVDRSKLNPGPYSAKITFDSNGGSDTIDVKMQVTALQPGHEPILQISPSVLSFTATDAAAPPSPQTITISNPGALPLNWTASSNSSWLTAFPKSDTVAKGATDPVAISVNTSSLLPGTYNGTITFDSQGSFSAQNAPQNVYVSVTVGARCTLTAQPSLLTFTSVYRLSTPPAQSVSLGTGQNCQTAISWTASTSASWLTVGTKSGNTPANPSVGIDTTGLVPGVYHGTVVFSSVMGTQTVAVTYTMGQSTTPLLGVSPGALTFSGVAGQGTLASQGITINNTGGGAMKWKATATTNNGGNWLSISPTSGQISYQPTTPLNVPATLLGANLLFSSSSSGQVVVNQSGSLNVSASLGSLVPGTYNGAITITATDASGNLAGGSPRTIGVSLVVQAACGVSTGPSSLNFTTVSQQATPSPQDLTISASGACSHSVNWKATLNGSWLNASATSGQIAPKQSNTLTVGVATAGLKAGTYNGSVTITATDSVTGTVLGNSQQIPVTLAVQPSCTLQAPSQSALSFDAEAGKNANPSSRNFTVSVSGACSGSMTITPRVNLGSGSGWLSVSPSSASLSVGQSATFTVSVQAQNLTAGSYTGSIALQATNSGVSIAGSPQTVGVSLAVQGTPDLGVSPTSLSIPVTTGNASLPVSITNNGGMPMNWTAALESGAPSFVSLSNGGSHTLGGHGNDTVTVRVDATGIPGGTNQITTSLLITATDPATGQAASNSPIKVPITISISSPSLQASRSSLSFTATAGQGTQVQSVTITNNGGDTNGWSLSSSSIPSWLQVSPSSGSGKSGESTRVTFTVDASTLAARSTPYTAQIQFVPTTGSPVTVSVQVTVKGVQPTPTPTPTATATPVPPTKVPVTPTTPPVTPTPTVTKVSVTPTVVPTKGPTPGSSPPPSTTSVSVTPTTTHERPSPTSTPTSIQPTPTPTTKNRPTRISVSPTAVIPTPTSTPESKPTRVVITPTVVPAPQPEPEPVPVPTSTPESKPTRVAITPTPVPSTPTPVHKPTRVPVTPTSVVPTPTPPTKHRPTRVPVTPTLEATPTLTPDVTPTVTPTPGHRRAR
jgi:hypothetical protein